MAAGIVVAGGYSTRFGLAEKALTVVDGEPMLRRVVREMIPIVDAVVIDCREDQLRPFGSCLDPLEVDPTFAVDADPDCGPVAGLERGLDAVEALADASAERVVLASCDRPGVTAGFFQRCLSGLDGAGIVGCVPRIDGRRQPLCGAYDAAALADSVRAATGREERRLLAVLDGLSICDPPMAGDDASQYRRDALRSVDSPIDARLWSAQRPNESSTARDAAGPRSTAAVPDRPRSRAESTGD